MTVPSVDLLLIAGTAAALLLALIFMVIALARLRRTTLAQTEQALAQQTVLLQRLADLETRVDATNVSVSDLGERLDRPQEIASQPNAAAPGYHIAIRLAKAGASRDELVGGCGLSTQEAELVHRLHAPRARELAREPGLARSHAA